MGKVRNKEMKKEQENKIQEDNSKSSSLGVTIFCSIFTVIMMLVCFILYKLYDAKTYDYDIDAVYYTEHNLMPELYKATIKQKDGKNIVMGNGILPLCNVEICEIERPKVKLGCSNLMYLYKNYGIKVTKINDDDEMLTEAGVQVGDFIQRIENEYIDTPEEVETRVAEFPNSKTIYTIIKHDNSIETVYLDSSKKLSFEGEEANVTVKAIGFTIEDKCYTYGEKGIKSKPLNFINLTIVNYAKGYSELNNKNSLELYTEDILKNSIKLKEESAYGVILEKKQGEWVEGREIEIGFSWEIEPDAAIAYIINAETGVCEEKEIVIKRERTRDQNGIIVNQIEGIDITEEMYGAPIVQNDRLVGFICGEGKFLAADKVYVELGY